MKYSIIYADPPWRYRQSKGQGVAQNHYQTMAIEELCRLPVSQIAAKDSVLFLWVTFPQLREGLQLMQEWGFTYKTTAFVWVKLNKKSRTPFFGLGYWTRSNAEICLLGVKGHPQRISKKVHQLIMTPVQEHSKKPEQTREKIVELMGDIPRIELFAREETEGWEIWGNEVDSTIELPKIPEGAYLRQGGQAACEAKAAGTH